MVLETDYKISKDLIWLADGYRTRVPHNSECEKDVVLPSDQDSFTLLPQERTNTYVERRVDTPDVLNKFSGNRIGSANSSGSGPKPQRPGTAPPLRSYGRPSSGRKSCWTGNEPNKSVLRPGSAYLGDSPKSDNTGSKRRVKSAGSVAARTRAIIQMRQGFTLVNKLYENDFQGQNINLHPASPAPDYRYFDRHSRCSDHTHMHGDLLRDRPQTACGGDPCGGYPRPVSAMSTSSQRSRFTDAETMNQPRRYINYHRPKTAPGTVSL